MSTLAVIVPYRDRAEHLTEFLQAFATHALMHPDKVPSHGAIKIIEQAPGGEFNRGMIKNIGYALSGVFDHICFHDVDYCPIRADYRPPSPGFWVHVAYKAAERVIDPRGLDLSHDERFTGGVVIFGRKEFDRVNGYSNSYWGWGAEDVDLRNRCTMGGLALDRRRGRFHLLPHDNEGYDLRDGSFTESTALIKNNSILGSRWPTEGPTLEQCAMATDGLSSLAFGILAREQLRPCGRFPVEKITVAIQ